MKRLNLIMERCMHMKQIRKLLILFIIVVLGSIGYGYYKGKEIPVIEKIDVSEGTVRFNLDNAGYEGKTDKTLVENITYDSESNTFEKLYKKSDLIVKVSLKNRKQDYNTICSDVNILDIYKGTPLNEKTIQVYEPFGYQEKDFINIFGACLPMRENQTYILFLKENADQRYQYISSLYGKYNYEQDAYMEVYDSEMKAKDMMQYDMLDFNKDKYYEIMKELGYTDLKANEGGYQRLAELKDTREIIRASFDQLVSKNNRIH